jgi:hypothetical protein
LRQIPALWEFDAFLREFALVLSVGRRAHTDEALPRSVGIGI